MRPTLGMLLSAAALTAAAPASAMSLATTKLSEWVSQSTAVIHGELLRTRTLLDPEGTPWTIYTVGVHRVLAGDFDGGELSFRCIGGPQGDGTFLELVGAPRLQLGRVLAQRRRTLRGDLR